MVCCSKGDGRKGYFVKSKGILFAIFIQIVGLMVVSMCSAGIFDELIKTTTILSKKAVEIVNDKTYSSSRSIPVDVLRLPVFVKELGELRKTKNGKIVSFDDYAKYLDNKKNITWRYGDQVWEAEVTDSKGSLLYVFKMINGNVPPYIILEINTIEVGEEIVRKPLPSTELNELIMFDVVKIKFNENKLAASKPSNGVVNKSKQISSKPKKIVVSNSHNTNPVVFRGGDVIHISGEFYGLKKEIDLRCKKNSKVIFIKVNEPRERKVFKVTNKADYWLVRIGCCNDFYNYIKIHKGDKISLYAKALGAPYPHIHTKNNKNYFLDTLFFKSWDKKFISKQIKAEQKRIATEKAKEAKLAKEAEERLKEEKRAEQRLKKEKEQKEKEKSQRLQYTVGQKRYIVGIISSYDKKSNILKVVLNGSIARDGKQARGVYATITGVPKIEYKLDSSMTIDLMTTVKKMGKIITEGRFLDKFEFISWGEEADDLFRELKQKASLRAFNEQRMALQRENEERRLVEEKRRRAQEKKSKYMAKPSNGVVLIYENVVPLIYSFEKHATPLLASLSIFVNNKREIICKVEFINTDSFRCEFRDYVKIGNLDDINKLIGNIDKARKWALIAKKNKVDIEKLLANWGNGLQIIFSASEKGNYCSLFIKNPKWINGQLTYNLKPIKKIVMWPIPFKVRKEDVREDSYKTTVDKLYYGLLTVEEVFNNMQKEQKDKNELFK